MSYLRPMGATDGKSVVIGLLGSTALIMALIWFAKK